MRQQAFPVSKGVPLTPNATPETVRLYRRLLDMGERSSILLGTSDHFLNMASPPSFFGSEQAFFANSGRNASLICYEYHDPEWLNRYGQDGTDLMLTKCQEAHAKGQILVLHNHSGNPATGELSRNGQVYFYPGPPYAGTGYVYDLTGSPVSAVLAGGAAEADHLAYLDRLASFIDALAPAPVILRLYHEANGQFFWWGAQNSTPFKNLWTKTVQYLRDEAQLTNVLYAWNCFADSGDFAAWYPGDALCDIVTLDYYNDTATPVFSMQSFYNDLITLSSTRPMMLAEFGSATHNGRPAWWTEAQAALPTFKRLCAAVMWRPPWGPGENDSGATKAAFSALANDPRVLTLR